MGFYATSVYSNKGVNVRGNPLLDNDVVSWVVEEALGKHNSPGNKKLGASSQYALSLMRFAQGFKKIFIKKLR